jgi:ribosome-binding factor A
MLRHELANILQFEMRDPRVRLATVLHLRVSRDLSHAEVGVSVLGDETEREACVEVLERAKGFIRSTLARRVRLRTTPELNFKLDRGAEHSQRISELLEDLHEEDT